MRRFVFAFMISFGLLLSAEDDEGLSEKRPIKFDEESKLVIYKLDDDINYAPVSTVLSVAACKADNKAFTRIVFSFGSLIGHNQSRLYIGSDVMSTKEIIQSLKKIGWSGAAQNSEGGATGDTDKHKRVIDVAPIEGNSDKREATTGGSKGQISTPNEK
jgi:hypothetical protein